MGLVFTLAGVDRSPATYPSMEACRSRAVAVTGKGTPGYLRGWAWRLAGSRPNLGARAQVNITTAALLGLRYAECAALTTMMSRALAFTLWLGLGGEQQGGGRRVQFDPLRTPTPARATVGGVRRWCKCRSACAPWRVREDGSIECSLVSRGCRNASEPAPATRHEAVFSRPPGPDGVVQTAFPFDRRVRDGVIGLGQQQAADPG